jgi:Fe-coproporphyrin III synthase
MDYREDLVSYNYDKKSLLYYAGRRLRWTLGDRSPFLAYMKVTKRCNLDCYYCPWHTLANDFTGEKSTDFWKTRIDELAGAGVRVFIFEGGEPTLRRDLQELLDHAHSHGASTILATNGVGKMWQFKPTSFTVSIDGPESFHDSVRGSGTFSRIRHNLEKRGSNRVAAITVISPKNRPYLDQMLEEVAPLVDTFLFTFLYPYKTVTAQALSVREMAEVKAHLLGLKSKYCILNTASHLKAATGSKRCEDWLTIAVNHEGKVEAGCFVEHVEPKNCKTCELSCYQVISAFYQFNLEAWFNMHRLLLRTI